LKTDELVDILALCGGKTGFHAPDAWRNNSTGERMGEGLSGRHKKEKSFCSCCVSKPDSNSLFATPTKLFLFPFCR
jgi:hypothetical protein